MADEAPRPLLELGVGMGTGLLPDYPGSDEEHYHFAAFPVLFYHGKIWRSDREDGPRARVVQKPIFGIDVSGSGAFPVDNNRAREGMKSLGWLVESGPRVFARLIDKENHQLRYFLLARPAATIRAGVIYGRGLVTGTGLQFEKKNAFWIERFSIYSKITAEWASKEYNEYFYSVGTDYATPARPAYAAKAGYLGTWFSTGVAYEFSDFIVSCGFSAISTKGSSNRASPLFRDDLNWSVYVGLAWFFYHSSEPGHF